MTHIKGNRESFYHNRPTAYKINSYNVDPTTQVAVASPGLDLTLAQTQEFDFFNVDQANGDTNIISLPSGMDIGEQIVIYTLDIVVLATAGAETINGSATQALVSATLYRIIKNTATTFVMASDSTGAALTAASTTLTNAGTSDDYAIQALTGSAPSLTAASTTITNAGTSDDYAIQALTGSAPSLTAQETSLSFVDENTPDFTISSLTIENATAGFSSLNEAQAFVEVVANLQVRVQEIEDANQFGFVTANEGASVVDVVLNNQLRISEIETANQFGFVTANEGASVVDVALNNQLRISEIEARLVAAEIIL